MTHLAIRVGDDSLTHGGLVRAAVAHVARLARLGVRAGDRVGLIAEPSLAFAASIVGNAAARVVSVPINAACGPRELDHVLGDAKPKIVLGRDTPYEIGDDDGTLDARGDDDAPLLVLYTSGTTGAPKGAVLTARNVGSNLDALASAWAWTDRDTIVHALPLFHVHGLVLGLMGALRRGGCLHLVPRFTPDALAHALEAQESSVLFAVPTMFHRLAESIDDERIGRGLRAARLLVSGSAALPEREHTRLRQATGCTIVERYGLTETLINTALRAPRPGYVGRALDGITLRLVDDARREIEGDAIGEIAVRGPNVFAGYLNRDDATREVKGDDGFFYTGDLATRDATGDVRIVGRRATDLIKTGGFKVGAGEIEAALLESEHVREVAVLGVPDDDLGERIVAFVVARAPIDPDALLGFARERLAKHKAPREIRFVESLPRNAMGKIQKAKLR